MTIFALSAVAVVVALAAVSAGRRRAVRGSREVAGNPFNVRRLSFEEREEYRDQWHAVEAQFVHRPAIAVIEADELTSAIMHARGFPVAEFDMYAVELLAKHPRVVEHYRRGHAVMESRGRGQVSTERLRQAMLHYRALFDELVNEGADVEQPIPIAHEVTPKPIIPQPAPDEYPAPPRQAEVRDR